MNSDELKKQATEKVDEAKAVVDNAANAVSSRYGWKAYVVAAVVILLLGSAVYGHVVGWLNQPKKVTTNLSKNKAQTADGIKTALNASHVPASEAQYQEFAEAIKRASGEKPKSTTSTTLGNYEQAADEYRQQQGGDAAIVVDPSNPDKAPPKPGELPAGTPVVLENHVLKAYPKKLLNIQAYPSVAGDIEAANVALVKRVKVFGQVAYVGPALDYDRERNTKVRIGVNLTVPLD